MRRSERPAKDDLGAPFLAAFARSGDFDPLRECLPFELALDFVFLSGMNAAQKRDVLMVSRERRLRLGRASK